MIARASLLARYGSIAVLCALLNIAVMIVCDRVAIHYTLATAISFTACVLVGYALHCRFSYAEPLSWAGLSRYTLAMALNFPLSLAAIWTLHDRLGLNMVWAAPIATLALAAYNFIFSRWAIVRRIGRQPPERHAL